MHIPSGVMPLKGENCKLDTKCNHPPSIQIEFQIGVGIDSLLLFASKLQRVPQIWYRDPGDLVSVPLPVPIICKQILLCKIHF